MKVLPEPSVKMGVETEIIVPADVYDKGYADGKKAGISEGIEQGADVEKKRWWGIFTDNGTRTAWTYGFAGWPADCIDPLFDVTPINATAMFTNITASGDKKLNIPEIEARNNIKFDFVSYECTFATRNATSEETGETNHLGLVNIAEERARFIENGNYKETTQESITHFSHNTPTVGYGDMLKYAEECGYILAYDGLTVEF